MSQSVAIVGASLTGLAIAVGLRQRGLPAWICDRNAGPYGGAECVLLSGASQRALDRLGVASAVSDRGRPLRELVVLHYRRGRRLQRIPLEGAGGQRAWLGIEHRALLSILRSQLGEGAVELGTQVDRVVAGREAVEVSFASGRSQAFSAVIGADGVDSTVRASLDVEPPPERSGVLVWRGLCPATLGLDPAQIVEVLGPHALFRIVPISEGLSWQLVARIDAGAREGTGLLRARFADWVAPVPQLLEATELQAVVARELERPSTPPVWGRGAVTLAGDAAHRVAPLLGQSAGLAIEDALHLADGLAGNDAPPLAFDLYERRQRQRAERAVALAARELRAIALGPGVLRGLRDTASVVGAGRHAARHLAFFDRGVA